MEWISVDDRLPPLGKEVYVYGILDEYSGRCIGTAYLDKDGGDYIWRTEDYWFLEVRCWLEMPDIPPVPQWLK